MEPSSFPSTADHPPLQPPKPKYFLFPREHVITECKPSPSLSHNWPLRPWTSKNSILHTKRPGESKGADDVTTQ